MLINLRNALMAGKRLPYDAEVEYLESTGTQWIDTGVPGVDGYTFKADFTYTSLYSAYNYIAGSSIGSANRIYFARLDRTSGLFRMTYNNSSGGSYYGVAAGGRYNLETVARQGFQSVKVDGVVVYGNSIATTVNTGRNFFIFAASSGSESGITGECAAKLYSAQFYDSNGVLVRDFIPVRVGGVGYMYDRVSGKLFGNAGTGDFVVGPDVVPVEYIESHGTEYIDTGLNSTTDAFCDFEIKFRKTSTSTSTQTGGYCAPYGYRYGTVFRYGIFGGTTSSITNFWAGVDGSASVPMEKDTLWHTVKVVNGGYVDIDGVRTAIGTGAVRANIGLLLFATVSSSSGASSYIVVPSQIPYCKIYNTSGVLIRDYKAIRVGTEGAMMDVLTRRIYRNAGTGAFTYGNDLKYPIPAS